MSYRETALGAGQRLGCHSKGKTKMLLTLENTSRIGRPVRIFDGTGEEIMYSVGCDTKTGRCICIARDPRGAFLVKDGSLVRVTENRPLPIRVALVPNGMPKRTCPTCKGDGLVNA